jgi:hypothetical protein
VLLSDLPGVIPATLNGMILYYRLMNKWSGLGDSTELSRMGLSRMCSKKIKDKYVSQCGAIVTDNVPISYREWKGKADNLHVVPDSVKNLLWDEILKHFTLPEGVEPANVKRWTLTRMATQFQKFKQQLDKDYIKKNRTPNWIEYPKLKEH